MTEGEQHRGARLAAFAFGGLLLGALIGGAVVLTRDDGADAPAVVDPDAPVAGVVTEDVPVDEIVLGHHEATAVVQHGDEVVIIDGLATASGAYPADSGADPHLRVWTVSASDPTMATQIDFPTTGPIGFLFAWWWDGEWGIDGVECPEPWRGDLSGSILADCGTTTFDVLAFDPASSTVRTVAGPLRGTPPNGGREDLQPVAVNGRTTMLRWGPSRELFTLTTNRTLTDIDDLAPERWSAIAPTGETFAALTRTGLGNSSAGVSAPRPVGDFLGFRRLDGTAWIEEPLPPLDTEVLGADTFADGDALVVRYRDPDNETSTRALVVDDAGALTWELAPAVAQPGIDAVRLLDGTATLDCDQLLELGADRCRLVLVPR